MAVTTMLAPTRILVVLLGSLVASLALAVGASAFSIANVTVTPQTPSGPLPGSGPFAAGAHPDFVTQIDFNGSGTYSADTAKTLQIHFAPGIVAFVNHVQRCTAAQFDAGGTTASSCPAGSAVGTAITGITTDNALVNTLLGGSVSGVIYNIEPPAGSPAAFGIDIAPPPLNPHIKVVAPISVDPHDLGLTASLTLPSTADTTLGTVNVHTDSITQTLYGYVAGNSFFTNPTSCIRAAVTVSGTSYTGGSASNAGSYTPTDCAHEPFSTTLTISANPSITDSPSAISADVKPGASDIPRVNSHVRSDVVTLPPGVLINPALAARLDACTDAGFKQSDTSVAASCPASSAVGDITFVSPILGAFPGKAYFGTQTPTDRLRLFLDVPLFGAHIKVSAHVHPDFTTGQITTVFDELPQIAFTDFQLTFHGGPQSALVTPTTCGTSTAVATVVPWSGAAASTSSGSFTTSYDGHGGACLRIFKPSFSTAVSSTTSGASPTFKLIANRPDRTTPIGRMTYRLPAGLVGDLALKGLTQCARSTAAQAQCPASSRVGAVAAVAGSGPEPPTLRGSVYLTKPQVAGDAAGLSVQVPARLGPVDAGIVIVGARLQLRPNGGLTATSDPIPALQQGIPLALRQLRVTIDRKGFMRNPSSCGKKTPIGHFDALGGGSADASATLAFSGCERLRFAPRIAVVLGAKGKTRTGAHPPLTTTITQRGSDAAIRRAAVTLPLALATNLTAVNAACTQAALAAGTCSKRAQVATARAFSPLVAGPVTGPVYLVLRGPGLLPKLVVQLRSPIAIQFEGIVTIGRDNRISTTFRQVPDLPLTKFTLAFHSGRYGAIAATQSLCKAPLRLRSHFWGQNGKQVRQRAKITVRGCPKHHRRQRHRGASGR
jgi:hypothetical protein